ncbi:MAG: hypothetical protein ACI835_001016 [Planctomycetota bacterium]|jgi:hypothetical protein
MIPALSIAPRIRMEQMDFKQTTDVEDALQRLLDETERQRAAISNLLSQVADERRGSARGPFDLTLHLVSQADIVRGRGLDTSDSGVGVEIESGLPFLLRMRVDGKTELRKVELVWAKTTDTGSQRLGFKFRDEKCDKLDEMLDFEDLTDKD